MLGHWKAILMKISKIPGLGRFGIFIDDVDFTTITNDEWMEIGKLHLQNLVTIIRDCKLTWDKQTDFCTQFGDTRYGVRYLILKKYPGKTFTQIARLAMQDDPSVDEIDRIRLKSIFNMQELTADGKHVMRVTGKRDAKGNALGMFAEGELLWHSNESGTLTFTPGVALLGAENMIGSSTGFITTPDYYENVSNAFRSELDDMILIHRFTPGRINPGLRMEQDEVMHANMCPEDDTEIPIVMRSPGGIIGLHYSTNTIYKIKGATKKESDKIFKQINKELFVEKYIYDHWYQSNNDFCLFDNSITLHRRLGDIKDRLCYRIQHDYSNLQTEFWQPYLHQPTAKKYEEEIKYYVDLAGIKDFKLPS
jgi:alpha-ketoglutarate-dependent taurine dioxygenase